MAMNSEHWPPDISGLNEAKALSRAAFQTMMSIVKFFYQNVQRKYGFQKKLFNLWQKISNILILKKRGFNPSRKISS